MKKQIKLYNRKKYLNIVISAVVILVVFNFNIHFVEAWGLGSTVNEAFAYLLFGFVQVAAFLTMMAVALIGFTVTSAFMSLLTADAIYEGWSVVRDFLNIFFIFFLLFSAFATIFQVSKWHIKSTWIMIIVMALLVNFSWPIARVIIDFSNITMVYVLNGVSNSDPKDNMNSLLATASNSSEFANVLVGRGVVQNDSSNGLEVMNVLIGIVVGFIYFFTMMAIAGILIVRVLALAVLLVLAPVGFVFAAFPSTKQYSSQWWDAFIKQAFIGPILMFFLILSIKILEGMGDTNFQSGIQGVAATSGGKTIETLMTYVLTVFILWMGIIAANKVGAGGASMAIGAGKKAMSKVQGMAKNGAMGAGGYVGRKAGAATGATAVYNRGKDKLQDLSKASKLKDKKAVAKSRFTKDRDSKLKNIENREVMESEKRMKESGVSSEAAGAVVMKEMGKKKEDRDQVKLRANMNLAMKGDDFGGDETQHESFAKAIENNEHFSESEKKALGKKVDKSFRDKGNSHIVMDNRIKDETYTSSVDAYDKMFANASGKDLAKEGKLMKRLATSTKTSDKYITQKIRTRVAGNAELKKQFLQNAGGESTKYARNAKII